jgi:hypothetical protein
MPKSETIMVILADQGKSVLIVIKLQPLNTFQAAMMHWLQE